MNHLTLSFVRHALEANVIKLVPEGRKLKSGRISPYFFDSGSNNTGEMQNHLAIAYAEAIKDYEFDVVFGPAYKGISLAANVALVLFRDHHKNVGYAHNRKEAKDHGEGGMLIGHPLKGKRVFIIDDVITVGGTAEGSISFVEQEGGKVIGYGIAFDRQEVIQEGTEQSASAEIAGKYGIPVVAAACLEDLIRVLRERQDPILDKVIAYRHQYGAKI